MPEYHHRPSYDETAHEFYTFRAKKITALNLFLNPFLFFFVLGFHLKKQMSTWSQGNTDYFDPEGWNVAIMSGNILMSQNGKHNYQCFLKT